MVRPGPDGCDGNCGLEVGGAAGCSFGCGGCGKGATSVSAEVCVTGLL